MVNGIEVKSSSEPRYYVNGLQSQNVQDCNVNSNFVINGGQTVASQVCETIV